jgi:hypothetical protein
MNSNSFKDSMDRMEIDQLHEVVVKLSENCFDLKKFCTTVLISVCTFITMFTSKRVDLSLFVAGFLIVVLFYLLDVQSYYYQERLRIRMLAIANQMAERNNAQKLVGVGMPLSEDRLQKNHIHRALFNNSMWFYGVLALLDVFLALLYVCGFIGGTPPALK